MSRTIAKRIVRYAHRNLTEGTFASASAETRALFRALEKCQSELLKTNALDLTAARAIAGWVMELNALEQDCSATADAATDAGRAVSGGSFSNSLDALADDITDMYDVLRHALQACRNESKVRITKPRKGRTNLVVRDAREELVNVRTEAKGLARKLKLRYDEALAALDELDVASDTDNEEVYEEYADRVAKIYEELQDAADQCDLVADQLESA